MLGVGETFWCCKMLGRIDCEERPRLKDARPLGRSDLNIVKGADYVWVELASRSSEIRFFTTTAISMKSYYLGEQTIL
jgi:hypothetical protein